MHKANHVLLTHSLWVAICVQNDMHVIQQLQDAVSAGPDAALDALTKCTGCKCCGHEGGLKSKRQQHGKGGCAACGTADGCTARTFLPDECQCAFHRLADERLLNRVVRRASETPGFIDSCRYCCGTVVMLHQDELCVVSLIRKLMSACSAGLGNGYECRLHVPSNIQGQCFARSLPYGVFPCCAGQLWMLTLHKCVALCKQLLAHMADPGRMLTVYLLGQSGLMSGL